MRKNTSKIYINIMAIFIIVLICLISNSVHAEEKQLKIQINNDVVEAKKEFSVKVEYNGSGIEDIRVRIEDTEVGPSYTNSHGIAYLIAPSGSGEFIIVAEDLSGVYSKSTHPIKVVSEPGFWESPYFPIVVAIICLIGAVVFVNYKQKKDIYIRSKEITNEKLLKKHSDQGEKTSSKTHIKSEARSESKFETLPYEPKPVRTKPTKDAKVEEIRISRPRKEKEVIAVEEKKDETEKVVSEKKMKKKDYDWFEGTDDVRYEIDKLTGEVDEEGIDKWYEGIEDLREKIDDKVKKKDKKKKEENNDNE